MKTAKKIYLGLILFVMYAPIFVLMVFSFNASRFGNAWEGFTLDWYRQLFSDPHVERALRVTLLVAVFSTIFSTAIGTTAAVGIDKMGKRGKAMLHSATKMPVAIPDIVKGLSLMLLFIFAFRLVGFGSLGFGTLLLSHIIFNVPVVILCVMPKLRQLDSNLYEAALDLGSSPARAFAQVILPQIWPGVVTGAMLAFTLSVDDFMVSYFTAGPGVQNLSILIFSMTRRGVSPQINALSTIIFAVVMIMLLIIHKRDQRLARKMEMEP